MVVAGTGLDSEEPEMSVFNDIFKETIRREERIGIILILRIKLLGQQKLIVSFCYTCES